MTELLHSLTFALPAALLALPAVGGAALADCGMLDREIKSALAANASYRYEQLFQAMVDGPYLRRRPIAIQSAGRWRARR